MSVLEHVRVLRSCDNAAVNVTSPIMRPTLHTLLMVQWRFAILLSNCRAELALCPIEHPLICSHSVLLTSSTTSWRWLWLGAGGQCLAMAGSRRLIMTGLSVSTY